MARTDWETRSEWETGYILVDGINLGAIAYDSGWHLATTIDGLIAAGLQRADAEAYADWIFGMRAGQPEDGLNAALTDEQWERLADGPYAI